MLRSFVKENADTRTIGRLLAEISRSSVKDIDDGSSVLETPLRFKHVRSFLAPGKLEVRRTLIDGEHGDDDKVELYAQWPEGFRDDVQKGLEANDCVIIVNGKEAAFADIIVLIPRTAVILVQCKFYRASNLKNSTVMAELCKMGATTFRLSAGPESSEAYGLSEKSLISSLENVLSPSKKPLPRQTKLQLAQSIIDAKKSYLLGGSTHFCGEKMADDLRDLTKTNVIVPVFATFTSEHVQMEGITPPIAEVPSLSSPSACWLRPV